MHGRLKVRTTEEQAKIKEVERQRTSAEYKKGMDIVFQKRKNQEWDDELLFITEKLLIRYPDVYTLWNIRREAFINNNWFGDKRKLNLENELSLTEISLKENPKSYYVWYQRTWIIEKLTYPNWERELNLCDKYLNLDERNFHCWDYRKYVVSKSNISNDKELEFTTSKILSNFSNYSSWHYRSKLLQKLYSNNVHKLPIRYDKHNEELDLVMNAAFTDPNDSSAWFYYRWLLDYWKSPIKLWRAVLTKAAITVAFQKEVPLNLELFLNNKKIECKWRSVNGKKFSVVWYAVFEKSLYNFCEASLKFEEKLYKLQQSNSLYEWIYKNEILSKYSKNSKLYEQMHNYQTLCKMEPFNKWAKLTSIHIMLIVNPVDINANIIKELNDLIKIDPLRANYYKDMRSKCILEYNIKAVELIKNENDILRVIDLSGIQLTTVSIQKPYLTFYNEINISNNCLGNQLYHLYILQECIKLDLSNNTISSLKTFPTLHNLKILLLSNNQIRNSEEILDLIKRHNLIILDLKTNPLLNTDLLLNEIKNSYPYLEILV